MKIVKVGALWCPGCIVMNKSWDKLKEKYTNITFENLDLDFDFEETEKYDVGDTLPVIIFLKDGKEYKRLVGESSFEDIESIIIKINEI